MVSSIRRERESSRSQLGEVAVKGTVCQGSPVDHWTHAPGQMTLDQRLTIAIFCLVMGHTFDPSGVLIWGEWWSVTEGTLYVAFVNC